MNIFLISLNYSPEKVGIGKYNTEFANEVVKLGHSISVLTAPPYYPEWKIDGSYSNKYAYELLNGVKLYRCPLFIPKKPTLISRLFHLFSFSLTSGLRLFTLFKNKPDLIISVQPTLFTTPFVLFYCYLFNVKSILHVQDFEVDAMLGLSGKKVNFFKILITKIESLLTCKFDYVSTISYKMLEKAKEKGVNQNSLILFPNWSDTNVINPSVEGTTFRSLHDIPDNKKIILYSGNMGDKQGLEIVVEAARLMNSDDVLFLMVGEGSNKCHLVELSSKYSLCNIKFLPLQDWELVPSMLNAAYIHLVIQKRGAADAVMPSKLTNILSCGGHAVITADIDTELGELSVKFPGIFKLSEPESAIELVRSIQDLLEQDLSSYNTVARDYAELFINKDKVINDFLRNFE